MTAARLENEWFTHQLIHVLLLYGFPLGLAGGRFTVILFDHSSILIPSIKPELFEPVLATLEDFQLVRTEELPDRIDSGLNSINGRRRVDLSDDLLETLAAPQEEAPERSVAHGFQ